MQTTLFLKIIFHIIYSYNEVVVKWLLRRCCLNIFVYKRVQQNTSADTLFYRPTQKLKKYK